MAALQEVLEYNRVHTETVLVLLPRTHSDVNLVDTENNTEILFSEILVEFFFLCLKGINSDFFSL